MEIKTKTKTEKITFDKFINLSKKGGKYQIKTLTGWEDIGDIYIKKNKKCYRIELSNGYFLEGSEDHLIEINTSLYGDNHEIFDRIEVLDKSTWIRLKNIKEGDLVSTSNGSFKIKNKRYIGIKDTYDLNVVSDDHKYLSNGISSHNTGKSSIVDGLAQRIVEKKVPRTLANKRLYVLDLINIVGGTKYRGQLEQRLQELLKELNANKDIVLFIDEFHTIIGAGGASGSLDIANIFKPALARGEIQVIGATTLDEYRKHIEKDGALERRFQKVLIEPTSAEDTIQILNNIKDKYQDHHNVIYTEEAIESCVTLTDRYVTDRNLPDKAIDALDEAGARVRISNMIVPKIIVDIEKKIVDIKEKKNEVVKSQKYEEAAKLRDTERKLLNDLDVAKGKWDDEEKNNKQTVDFNSVSQVVSMMSGIPLEKISEGENEKLAKMGEFLKGVVIGQDEAVDKMVKSIQRNRVGLKEPGRPIGVFLCCGESGTGKCHGKGTKIMMHDGSIKNVEDIKVGEMLMGDDSTPRIVYELAKGRENMYKIIPNKGGDIFTCNGSHILSLKNTSRTKENILITIDNYLKKGDTFKKNHLLYRMPVNYKHQDVEIDPYFLGLWLGDGTSTKTSITTADAEIVDFIYETAKKNNLRVHINYHVDNKSNTYSINSGMNGGKSYPIRDSFKKYNLFSNKHIPIEYLRNSVDVRKSVLAGLIDSDGYMSQKWYNITTKFDQLKDDIITLCRSLGYRACHKIKTIKWKQKDGTFVDKNYHSINISGDLSDLPIKLKRKISEKRLMNKSVLVDSFKIESIGIDDYYGFVIGGNHLYLLGDNTVTHNTFLAKNIAKYMFNSEDSLIRLDMSEYMEKIDISKISGSSPGYVGWESGSSFLNAVRTKPYNVTLLDEIEKCNPDVLNLFLQIFDEGHMTDSHGRKISFKNTIIIMTSNIGVRKLRDFGSGIGFNTTSKEDNKAEQLKSTLEKEVNKKLPPELINRIDDIIIFNSLSKEDLEKILNLEVSKLLIRIEGLGFKVKIDKSMIDYLVVAGFDEKFGARPMKRAIQKWIEDPITGKILSDNPIKGSLFTLSYDRDKEETTIKIGKGKKE